MKQVAFLVLAAVLCIGVARSEEEEQGIPVGSVAPELHGDAWVTDDGKAPELKGKVYLIDFFFEKCSGCMAAMPQVRELAGKYSNKGLIVVGASLDKEVATVKAVQAKMKLTYPLLAGSKFEPFKVDLFPAMFLVDKTGKVIWKGDVDDKALVPKIEKALAEK